MTGAPILDGALAAMECRTTAVHDGGDHSIVVGEVLGVTEPVQRDGEAGPLDPPSLTAGTGGWPGTEGGPQA